MRRPLYHPLKGPRCLGSTFTASSTLRRDDFEDCCFILWSYFLYTFLGLVLAFFDLMSNGGRCVYYFLYRAQEPDADGSMAFVSPRISSMAHEVGSRVVFSNRVVTSATVAMSFSSAVFKMAGFSLALAAAQAIVLNIQRKGIGPSES